MSRSCYISHGIFVVLTSKCIASVTFSGAWERIRQYRERHTPTSPLNEQRRHVTGCRQTVQLIDCMTVLRSFEDGRG
eukprot:5065040-Amphidinium_carterae.1